MDPTKQKQPPELIRQARPIPPGTKIPAAMAPYFAGFNPARNELKRCVMNATRGPLQPGVKVKLQE